MKKFGLFLFVVVVVVAVLYLKRSEPQDAAQAQPSAPDVLFGVNLGGWLADELRFGEERFDCDLPGVHEQIRDNLGVEKADALLDIYRNAFITAEDFARIKSLGFNAIRLPVSAAYFYDKPGQSIRHLSMENRIAWVLEQASVNDLSVILNIRVRAGEWAARPAVNEKRFRGTWSERDVNVVAGLWSKLAAQFKDEASLAAYDLSVGSCGADADMMKAYSVWANAIIEEDTSGKVLAPWPRPAVDRFPEAVPEVPLPYGFTVDALEQAITSADAASEISTFLEGDLHLMNRYWKGHGISRSVSEYNPELLDASGAEWLGTYRSEFKRLGWDSMLWTWKAVSFGEAGNQAAALANGSAEVAVPDFSEADQSEIQEFFESLGEVAFTVDPSKEQALTAGVIASYKANEGPALDMSSDETAGTGDWSVVGVGGIDCIVTDSDDAGFTITSSGLGADGFDDEFGFVYRAAEGRINLSAVVVESELSSASAGAGLMVRASLDDESPYLLVYKTAAGRIVSVADNANGQPSVLRLLSSEAGNEHLRIMTDGVVLKASCSTDGQTWPVAANFTAPWITNQILLGATVFSGHEYRASKAVFSDVRLIVAE